MHKWRWPSSIVQLKASWIATKINKYENKITKIVKNTSNPANVKSTISFVLISEQEIANSGEMSQKK
jgi:hypothetical protein